MLCAALTKRGRLYVEHQIVPDDRCKEIKRKPLIIGQNDNSFAHIFAILCWLELEMYFYLCPQIIHLVTLIIHLIPRASYILNNFHLIVWSQQLCYYPRHLEGFQRRKWANGALVMLLSGGKERSYTQVFVWCVFKLSQMSFPSCMLMQSLEKMLLIS